MGIRLLVVFFLSPGIADLSAPARHYIAAAFRLHDQSRT
jgi:hypothetical protein